jgi:anti-sigma B factor antagonist
MSRCQCASEVIRTGIPARRDNSFDQNRVETRQRFARTPQLLTAVTDSRTVAGYNPAQRRAANEQELAAKHTMALQISIRESGDVTILDLQGRATIDGGGTALLDNNLKEMAAGGARQVLLNLADVTQLDSSGVSIIVKAHRSLRSRGGDLRLLRPSNHALEVFRALHLTKLIPIFEDENQALASFPPSGDCARPQSS